MRGRFLSAAFLGSTFFAMVSSTALAATVRLVIPTLDYPASGATGTRASDINNNLDIAFQVDFPSGGSQVGFRAKGQKPITPLSAPGSTGFTVATQLNDSDTMVGDFFDGTTYHGFFLDGSTFTQFDVSGSTETTVFGINNAGNFGGQYEPASGTSHVQAYIDVDGIEADVTPAGSVGGSVNTLNNLNGSAGFYSTSDPFLNETTCGCHGFIRTPAGKISSFDPTGSVSTVAKGINNTNVVVGRYYDSGGAVHGFVYFAKTGGFIQYDYPGAIATSLNGINDRNYIAGRYTDTNNVNHGFIAILR